MNLAAAAATSGSNPLPLLLILIVSLAGIAAYWVPTIVAVVRKVPNVGTVVIIDLWPVTRQAPRWFAAADFPAAVVNKVTAGRRQAREWPMWVAVLRLDM